MGSSIVSRLQNILELRSLLWVTVEDNEYEYIIGRSKVRHKGTSIFLITAAFQMCCSTCSVCLHFTH